MTAAPDGIIMAAAIGLFDETLDFNQDGVVESGVGVNSDIVAYVDFVEQALNVTVSLETLTLTVTSTQST